MIDNSLIESLYVAVRNGVADWTLARNAALQLVQEALEMETTRENVDVQTHPLGFCAIRWRLAGGRALRVHIWARDFDWRQSPPWPIHDHVFDFSSAVLEGRVINKLYRLGPPDEQKACNCAVYQVDYADGASRMTLKQPGARLKLDAVQAVNRGEMYRVRAGVLHRSKLAADTAITVLATLDHQGYAAPRVIGDGKANELVFRRTSSWNAVVQRQVLEIARSMCR